MMRGNGTGEQKIHVEEPEKKFAARLSSWRIIAGVIVALVGAGGAAAAYLGRLATRADVAEALVTHERADAAVRNLGTRVLDDHEHRIRAVEEEARDSKADRRWIIDALHRMARSQRVEVPEPPARGK